MYHWIERGKMTFLWATPNGAGTAPPEQMPREKEPEAKAPVEAGAVRDVFHNRYMLT